MTKTEQTQVIKAVELPEKEMVAIVIRAFFEVPEEETTDDVLAKTDPRFRAAAQEAVRNLMLYWAAKVRGAGFGALATEQALDSAGLGVVQTEGAGHG